MEIYRRLGERIRHARLRAGLTQPQLAELLKVSKGIISRWETGYARPSLDRLEPLAKRLGVSIETLLGFTQTEESGAYRARSLPVWEMGVDTAPDFKEASCVGEVLTSEQEALIVEAGLLIKDNSFAPHLLEGDIVGIQTKGKPRLGDVIFLKQSGKIYMRRYGGRRRNEILLPMDITKELETPSRLNHVGVFRWLHRPGHLVKTAR